MQNKTAIYQLPDKIKIFVITKPMTEYAFLPCSHHQSKELNLVCLMETCRESNLCCEECIKDSHEGHKKKSLKTLLSVAEYLKSKGPSKSQQSENNTNREALLKIVDQNEAKTISTFRSLRQSINQILDKIESNLEQYFGGLSKTINTPLNEDDPLKILEATLNDVSSSKEYGQTVKSVQKLLLLLNKVGKDGHLQIVQNNQQVLERLVSQSNKEIGELIDLRLTEMRNILAQSSSFIVDSTSNVHNLWENPLYNFTPSLCHQQMKVIESTRVVSNGEGVYLMALMQPQINMTGSSQVFRFKISKLTSNWISVGVAVKKQVQQNNYTFDPYSSSHGAYMVSANGGSWSHEVPELNNKVRAFKYEEGDMITCIVDPGSNKIYFVKEPHIAELLFTPRETYQLSFQGNQDLTLHPCVTIHYLQNSVEYVPATNVAQIPKYDLIFSQIFKHFEIQIINGKSAIISDTLSDGYRACLLNRSLEDDRWNSTKHFSFRISNCGEDWVGVGICHKKIASQTMYEFEYEKLGHGYYMISSNGGVWSSTDPDLNNKLGCWKFKTGDVIECQVQFGDGPESPENRIIFKKGKSKYVLPIKYIPDDKLYPCVMLHYIGDEVSVLPLF